MAAATGPVLIDRADVHKSCKSLEGLVSVLSNYTEAVNSLATVQKKLAKALKETASIKGTNNVPAGALTNSAAVLEVLAEVDMKFAKVADKEVENVGSELRKWFKKLAKEEKAHDERIANANAKIKQAGQAYEKKAKRKDRDAADEHTRYLAILNAVGPEMSQDKYNHSLLVTQRHTLTLSGCAASLSRLAEAEWARACESVRRSAPCIGSVGEWRALCEAGWSGPTPDDLPDLGSPEVERNKRNHDAMDKNHDATRTLMPPPPSLTHEYAESLTSVSTTRNSPSAGRSSETTSNANNSQPQFSRPPSPPSAPEPTSNVLQKKGDGTDSAAASPAVAQRPMNNELSRSPEASGTANSSMTDPSTSSSGEVKSPVTAANERTSSADSPKRANPELAVKVDAKPSHARPSLDPPPSLPNIESLLGARRPTKSNELVGERERDQRVTSPPLVSPKPTRPSGATALHRRLSAESTTSNNSVVASMRDRYDTRPIQPVSPPPRDLPRLAQSVTDLATRYTPVDPPRSPHRGLAAERFPTFQDRYPRPMSDRDRDRDRYRSPPPASVAERDYFAERDDDRYHSVIPAVDADLNRFLRDDRERYRPRSPDRYYADEMGMRDRSRRVDPMTEERTLQEREEQLRERERQLEVERARLASARGGGYANDRRSRSPHRVYGAPRLQESPEPVPAESSLRPPQVPLDHSPNCGCQRCSARHYASSTTSLPRAYEKPDPPIQLRPQKQKGWLRRMSMPLGSQPKSGSVSNVSMSVPEEDGRIRRRSFEVERDEPPKFGGTMR